MVGRDDELFLTDGRLGSETRLPPNKRDGSWTPLLEELSKDRLMEHTREISRYVRLSGSAEESRALRYVRERLEEAGFAVREHKFESYVGIPQMASLAVAGTKSKYAGTVPAISVSTPSRGLEAELVDVGSGESYDHLDPSGKVVLIHGLCSPRLVRTAEEKGAVAEVFVNDSHAHEGIASPVWGTPTPETAGELPRTPSMSIDRASGQELGALLKKRGDKVRVVLKTKVENRWTKVPVLIADLDAERDFVLLSGHIDSWHLGAMDNASGNSLMIEVGRVLSKHRGLLRRGLRLAFWSGHSHGRYSGSTWYADMFWEELYERCVAHVNVDSPGALGATDMTRQQVMKESEQFVTSAIREVAGQDAAGVRFARAGDQSFWGLGITSMLCEVSEQPVQRRRGDLQPWGWWWHTPQDTIDKIEPDFLLRDARVYLRIVGGLCACDVLPFDFEPTLKEIEGVLGELSAVGGKGIDLARVSAEVRELWQLVRKLERNRGRSAEREDMRIMNDVLKRLGRLLIPVNYTKAGPFDQDLAIPTGPLPGIQPLRRLREMEPDSDEYRFLATRIQREVNRTLYAILEAKRAVEQALQGT